MPGKLSGGDPLSKISAREWNRHCDVADWWERTQRLGQGGGSDLLSMPGTVAKALNNTAAQLNAGDVVELSGIALDEVSRAYPWFNAIVRSGADPFCAVALEPIPDGFVGPVQVSGFCVASVDIQDADNTHARVVPSSTTLKGDFGGWARIVYKPSGTGVKTCVVSIGNCEQITRKARSTSSITAGGSGSVNVYVNGANVGSVTAYYDWMTGGGAIGSGLDLLIQYFHDDDRWHIVGAECGA